MGFFSSLAKAAVDVATLPVSVVKDVATLGGTITGKSEPYTASKIKEVGEDIYDAVESIMPD